MNSFRHDLRFAVRQLRRNPAFTAVIVATLALGIGANTAIFSFLDALLIRSLPVAAPDRLVAIRGTRTTDAPGAVFGGFLPVSYSNFEDYRSRSRAFSSMYAHHGAEFSFSAGGQARRLFGEFVSANYFDVLGLTPAHGRAFLPAEDETPGADPVVVLSHGMWSRQFGADPDVLGTTVRLNGHALTVVGIGPEAFSGTSRTQVVDLWIPVMMFPQIATPPLNAYFDNRAASMFFAVGRLGEGIGFDQAVRDMDRLSALLREDYPEFNAARGVQLLPLKETAINPAERATYVRAGIVLMTLVGILLLIACANIANLLLARAVSRRREVAIRIATGAKRRRISQQFMTESILLSLLGGAAGLILAVVATKVLWTLRPPDMSAHAVDLSMNPRVLFFALAVSVLTGVIFGTAPALRAGQYRVAALTTKRSRSVTGGRNNRLGSPLMAAQVAVCLAALVVAGLFIQGLRSAIAIDIGFRTDNLAIVSFHPAAQGWDATTVREFYRRTVEEVSALPGVSQAAIASVRPFSSTFTRRMYAEGQTEGSEVGYQSQVNSVDPGYFDVSGIQILSGRQFDATDTEDSGLVAILNETAARLVWGGEDPIGRRFIWSGDLPPVQVVGLARDAKYIEIGDEPMPYVYLPLAQSYSPGATLFVRTNGQAAVLGPVQQVLRRIEPTLPLVQPATGTELLKAAQWAPRAGAMLTGTFGVLALLLVLIGVYGVTAFSVGLRRKEMAIRMAVGAQPGRVIGMVILDAMRVIAIGLAAGLVVSLAATRLLSGLLYGVQPTNLPTFVGVISLMTVVGVLGSYFPARRAARIDCAASLRVD